MKMNVDFLAVVIYCSMMIIVSANAKNSKARIIGGRVADINEFPYQVSIQFKLLKYHLCGGSIIHEYFILTAAHCVDPMKNIHYLVEIATGTSIVPSEGGSILNIKAWKVHQKFDTFTNAHDVALVFLETPIQFSETQKPIALATKTPTAKEVGWVTGYGFTSTEDSSMKPRQLMAAEVPVMNIKKCKKIMRTKDAAVANDAICAGGGTLEMNNKDACQGDSGGPFVVEGVQVGIVSWGIGCGGKGLPGVYTNVAMQWKWINENSEKWLKTLKKA